MRKGLLATGPLLFFATSLLAQHGTARVGYMGYEVDTWTGAVTTVNDQTREITLVSTAGDKAETFTGVLKAGLKDKRKDGSEGELKMSEISIGSLKMAFYTAKTREVEGKKIKIYEIFRLDPAYRIP